MSIQKPDYLPLDELLDKRLFRIPRYQRAYSWKSKQRSDMFNDIRQLHDKHDKHDKSDGVHFMATVVGLCYDTRQIGTTKYQFIDVVDGQQRLTTLVLLLKTIECKIKSLLKDVDWRERTPKEKQEEAKRERKELANLLVNPTDKTQVLIQTNHDSSQYFANYLIEGQLPPTLEEVKTLADKEMLSAIRDCQRFVDKWDDLFELLSIIKNQLYFIFHEITDEASVYTVFEVLNNRGLYVSWLDRFKSKLMAVVFENDAGNSKEHIERLHRIWGEIYEAVGLREGLDTEALRFAATLRGAPVGEPLSEEKAVNRLMYEVGTNAAKTVEISNWVLKVTKAVKRVYDDFSPSKEVVINIIQVRILATAIFLRRLPVEVEYKLLNQWEKTSFRIFGLSRAFGLYRITAKAVRGDYLRLAHQITNNIELSVDEMLQRVKKLGSLYGFNSISDSDCYTDWANELRYLLYRYEQYLAESQGNLFSHTEWNSIWKEVAVNSIEHIYPQSKADQIEIDVHRIGNLLLLPPRINSGLSNKDPVDKTEAYRNTRLLSAEAVADIIEKMDEWNHEDIAVRSYEIAKWVDETFRD